MNGHSDMPSPFIWHESGKSTAMRMIMRLDNRDAGYAKVNGRSYDCLKLSDVP